MKMIRISMILIAVLATGAALAARPHLSRIDNRSATIEAKPVLLAVTFSSAWCSSCKIIKPRLAAALPAFEGRPVRFIELDFTFGEEEKARRVAEAEGFLPVFEQFAGATGFTLLVEPETGRIIDMLTINHSTGAMKAAIAAALAVVEIAPRSVPGDN